MAVKKHQLTPKARVRKSLPFFALSALSVLIADGAHADPRIPAAVQLAQARAQAPVPTPAAVPAPAPASTAAPLDMVQIYRLAAERDATLAAARSARDARIERLPQARAQLLPNISANATRFKNELESTTLNPLTGAPVTSERDYFSSTKTLVLRQPLFRPALIADFKQARAQVEDAEAQLAREVQNLAVRVSTSYLQALLAQEQLALAAAQKTSYGTQLEAARRQFSAGSGTRTDVDEAMARVDLSVARELEARQQVDFTLRTLQMLVDQPVGPIARLDAAKLPLVPPTPDSLAAWVERAEQASPEVRALVAQREAARQEVQKARAGHLPQLDAIAQWSKNQSDSINNLNTRYEQKQIGLQLNVPLFAGGMVNSQVRQALAEEERVGHALEALRRDLALRVEKEYRGVTEGVLRVRALEQAVRSAQTAADSARRSYQAGSRTLVDVLNSEEAKVSAQRDLAEARYTYILSRIRLLSLAGEADEAAINQANAWLAP